jgi:hypothetical protein
VSDATAHNGGDPGREAPEDAPTFWEGEPCQARRVSIVVANDPRFVGYWASELIGERRDAVEVTTAAGETFYLDDERYKDAPASGWETVTVGRGMPTYGHRELAAEPGSVEERAAADEPELPDEESDATATESDAPESE